MSGEFDGRTQYNHYDTAHSLDALVGRIVVLVDVTGGDSSAEIFLDSGDAFRFELYGDCCSSSHFTADALAQFRELIGARILAVEDRTNDEPAPSLNEANPGDVNSWHFLVFTTDRGHVTIDWRNDSNGYYDGMLSMQSIAGLNVAAHDAALAGHVEVAARLRKAAP